MLGWIHIVMFVAPSPFYVKQIRLGNTTLHCVVMQTADTHSTDRVNNVHVLRSYT